MPVYIDGMNAKYGRMKMCHMIADTLEELHAMADTIGVQRKWFQNKASFPHYDICLTKRASALRNGALTITISELGHKMRELRQTSEYSPDALRTIYQIEYQKP